jgi:hypothetical protein
MAPRKPKAHRDVVAVASPKFPYTTKPGTLRKLLKEIPERQRPPKFTGKVLKTWGFGDSNDISAVRVLKNIGLLSESGETGDNYIAYMNPAMGPRKLGELVRAKYSDLFSVVKDPARAPADELTRFFNTHSGGSTKTIEYQVQAFKALADHAEFAAGGSDPGTRDGGQGSALREEVRKDTGAALHIDLHVHLPENKTLLDYAGIFASIAEHILGRKP